MAKYKAVLFDLDDTLTKTWRVKWEQHKTIALERYGIKLTDETLAKHWGKPLEELWRTLYKDYETPFSTLLDIMQSYNDRFQRVLQNDTQAVIQTLLEAGLKIGIITGSHEAFVRADLARLQFPSDSLASLACFDKKQVHKPNPAVFGSTIDILRKHGIFQHRHILYVGDSLDDFYAARDAGIDFVGITTGLVKEADFLAVGVQKTISRLSQLPALIELG